MVKIVFWNTEGGTEAAPIKAKRSKRRYKAVRRSNQLSIERHAGESSDRRFTRSLTKRSRKRKADDMEPSPEERLSKASSRELKNLRTELWAEQKRIAMRNKAILLETLPYGVRKCDHVFFCEVVSNHLHAQSSIDGQITPMLKCYSYYNNGTSTPLSNDDLTGGPKTRIPKYVMIDGTKFYFWHAPSGDGAKKGKVVANVFRILCDFNEPFVLFGDLNADPEQLVQQGLDWDNIIPPEYKGGTRISGRTLDYAITNAPREGAICRRLFPFTVGFDIKIRTGSDHMPMVLEY